MNAPASPGTSDSGAAAGSDTGQGSESSGESEESAKTYTVTLQSDDADWGKVQIDNDPAGATVSKTVASGTEITIRAIPETGYNLGSWSDGNGNSKRTITVTSDINLTAEFAM